MTAVTVERADRSLGVRPFLPDDVTISPSALEAYGAEGTGCPRKWAIGWLLKIRTDSAASILGTKVHALAEQYGKTGRYAIDPLDPLPGQIFDSLREHLAIVGAQHEREFWYEIDGMPGVLHGLIDVYVPRDSTPLTQDIKTTKNWRWQKTPVMLEADTQANVYALFGCIDNDADASDLEWIYGLTSGTRRETRVTRARVTREHARSQVLRHAETASQLVQLTRKHRASPLIDANDIEPNPRACQAFGGCPHFASSRCRLTPEQSFGALLSDNTTPAPSKAQNPMDIAQQLASFQAANGQPAANNNASTTPLPGLPSAAPTPPAGGMPLPSLPGAPAPAAAAPTAPVAPEPPQPGTMAYAALRAQPLPAGTNAPNGKPLPPTVIASGVMRIDTGFVAVHEYCGIDQAKAVEYLNLAADHYERERNTPPVNPPEQAIAPTDDLQRAAIAANVDVRTLAAPDGNAAPVAPAAEAAPTATEAPAKKGRGRPKKAAAGSAEAGAVAPQQDAVTLYVDCAPLGAPYTECVEIFAKAHASLAALEPPVLDFGLLPFGEGAARFRVYAEAHFKHAIEQGERSFVLIGSQSREGSICLATFAAIADLVVKGV